MAAKIVSRGDPIEPIYLNNLRVAARGWGVVSGLAVSQRGAGANMSVDIATGEAWINGTKVTKGSTTNETITAAHASYARYDLVVINSSGTISVIDGTAAATSYANDYDLQANNAILLSEVYVPATDTTIEDAQITDKQIISFIESINAANGIAGLDASALLPNSTLQSDVCRISSGNYTGNNTVNRAIPHGLGKVPKFIWIEDTLDGRFSRIVESGIITREDGAAHIDYSVTATDSTNFYVGNSAHYGNSGNSTGQTFKWTAFA